MNEGKNEFLKYKIKKLTDERNSFSTRSIRSSEVIGNIAEYCKLNNNDQWAKVILAIIRNQK